MELQGLILKPLCSGLGGATPGAPRGSAASAAPGGHAVRGSGTTPAAESAAEGALGEASW